MQSTLDQIVIVDNFFENPEEIRELAFAKTYSEPPVGTPRLARTARCTVQEARNVVERIVPHVPYINVEELYAFNVLFRYTLAGAQKKTFCHVDKSTYAAIVYLTKPEHCAGGTSIFRHKPTGDEIYKVSNAHLYNYNDPNHWELIKQVEMVHNRLVVYPGKFFHSITPVFFGGKIENARLTQNIFIYRSGDGV